jgi:nucleotide-binding universal stress UspA family protein
MFSKILCPIDFTTYSHRALEHAVAIARSHGASVTGISVLDDAPAYAAINGVPRWTRDDLPRMQAQVLKILHETNAPSPSAVAVLGNPALEIEKLANTAATDLIVMPVHGWRGAATRTCGTVTEQILCHASVPVLLIPDAANPPAPEYDQGFRRIVCGINFSPASLKALRYAGDIAAFNRAELVVTHVLNTEDTIDASSGRAPSDGDDVTSLWQRRLHAAARSDVPTGITVRDYLTTGDPAKALLRIAEDERCDLIVIGGHRGNPSGCVMNAVVSHSRSPVLTVRVCR